LQDPDETAAREAQRSAMESRKSLAEAEAFAEAIAARLAGQNPEVARKIVEYLNEQTRLLGMQQEHLLEEHSLKIAKLRDQLREGKLRRSGIWIRTAIRVLLAISLAIVVVGVFATVRGAVTSRNVVVDPFDTPPTLAAKGLSGKVLASEILDVLTRIQAASRSTAQRRAVSNAWTHEISIEDSDARASFGRLLQARLGQVQHIDGDLVQTDNGTLALTVRSEGIMSKTFVDEARNIDALVTAAAEYLYGQSQPGLWAAYLAENDRAEEAIRFARGVYPTANPAERPYLLDAWANALSSRGGENAPRESLALYREALNLKPDFWGGDSDLMRSLARLGDEEGAVRTGERLLKTGGARIPKFYYEIYDSALWDLPGDRAAHLADIESRAGTAAADRAASMADLELAAIDVQMHDPQAAAMRMEATPVDDRDSRAVAQAAFDRALLAEDGGDLEAAARQWDQFAAAYAAPAVSTSDPKEICFAALTYERTGQSAKADAALQSVGNLTFVDCYRLRGDLLDLRGDWAGAQEWYAKAVQLAPDIPSGYYSWGAALARHGDLDAAAAKFKDAHQRGPHWADPLKAWGDVLERQGKTKDAAAKYQDALKYAPNWKELIDRRASATMHST